MAREISLVESVPGQCPICGEECAFVAGRGYCRECSITFAQPRVKRAELLKVFELMFFVSKQTGVYHREGCKYLRNASPDNIIKTSEPYGRACACVKTR